MLGGSQGVFPHGAELFPLPILVHPMPRCSLDASLHPQAGAPTCIPAQPHPWPLSPSNLDLELTRPLHSPGDLRPCMTIPHTSTSPSQFSQSCRREGSCSLFSLSPPDISQPCTSRGQELALLLTPFTCHDLTRPCSILHPFPIHILPRMKHKSLGTGEQHPQALLKAEFKRKKKLKREKREKTQSPQRRKSAGAAQGLYRPEWVERGGSEWIQVGWGDGMGQGCGTCRRRWLRWSVGNRGARGGVPALVCT